MSTHWYGSQLAAGTDAYDDWNTGDGSDFYPIDAATNSKWRHALLTLAPGRTPAELVEMARSPANRDDMVISAWWHGDGTAARQVPVVISDEFVGTWRDRDDIARLVDEISLGQFLPDAPKGGAPAAMSDPPRPAGNAPVDALVVVGVIDDAIAIAHERFRAADGGTRVQYAWLQDSDPATDNPTVAYGRELEKAAIDGLFERCSADGQVDEDLFYRRTGQGDFGLPGLRTVMYRHGHGTHVMDLFAGYDPADDDARRPIVCVQLPAQTTADTSGAGLSPNIEDAVGYILDRADRIAQAHGTGHLPVVINFSYGTYAGPHNATAPLERQLDRLIEARTSETGLPLDIVMPAGNGHLSQCHARLRLARGRTERLTWRVLPDDRTSSFVEVWLPARATTDTSARLNVRLVPPDGEAGKALNDTTSGKAVAWRPGGKAAPVLCKLSWQQFAHCDGRGRFTIAITPTTFHGPNRPLSPSGDWTIELENTGLGEGEQVEIWVQRDDTPAGYLKRGRQSRFEHPGYRRYQPGSGRVEENDSPDCPVRRSGTLSAIATARHVVTVGAMLDAERVASEYSAAAPEAGDAEAWSRAGPDGVATADDSRVHRGILAAGTRSGSRVAVNGTSVAAPQVARYVADARAGGDLQTAAIELVRRKAEADEALIECEPGPVNRYGPGRMWQLPRPVPGRTG